MKKSGRPFKPETKKYVAVNTTYTPENYRYIMDIINRSKLTKRGNFARIVNQIITDHRQVKAYKETELAKIKAKAGLLGGEI